MKDAQVQQVEAPHGCKQRKHGNEEAWVPVRATGASTVTATMTSPHPPVCFYPGLWRSGSESLKFFFFFLKAMDAR